MKTDGSMCVDVGDVIARVVGLVCVMRMARADFQT